MKRVKPEDAMLAFAIISFIVVLILAAIAGPVEAQRGGQPTESISTLPDCDTDPPTGACPRNKYTCESAGALYRCTSPNTWTQVSGSADLSSGATLGDGTDTDRCVTFNVAGQDYRICHDVSEGVFELDTDGTLGDGQDVTISAAGINSPPTSTPAIVFVDGDTTDEDDSAKIQINCTDTGSGTEDCDMIFFVQEDGAMQEIMRIDGDQGFMEFTALDAGGASLPGIKMNDDNRCADTPSAGDSIIARETNLGDLLFTNTGCCSTTTTTECVYDADCPATETCARQQVQYIFRSASSAIAGATALTLDTLRYGGEGGKAEGLMSFPCDADGATRECWFDLKVYNSTHDTQNRIFSVESSESADTTYTEGKILVGLASGTSPSAESFAEMSYTGNGGVFTFNFAGDPDRYSFASTALVIPSGADPAATCTVGEIFIDTDSASDTNCTTAANGSLCVCTAADTWTAND